MKTLYPLFLLSILLFGACSYLSSPKKVECCESKATCCYGQMCCLPRYATAAGVEPKVFTPEVPVYGAWQDLTPPPGAVIIKRGWLAQIIESSPHKLARDERIPLHEREFDVRNIRPLRRIEVVRIDLVLA